ncbi:hypothetical protein KSS87_003832 [Heliosperma pusillum]|nr:hypothetical protein KSS87_003832 [Heliosperma pusillum]
MLCLCRRSVYPKVRISRRDEVGLFVGLATLDIEVVSFQFFEAMDGIMALEKHIPSGNQTAKVKPLSFPLKNQEKAELMDPEMETDVDVDLKEVYFLIMHFLSSGPCQRTCGQFWNELLEHDLLPRRYHAWYSRSGVPNGDENDDGVSFPLSYNKVAERYGYIEKDHLVRLLKQLLLNKVHPLPGVVARNVPNAADVPTLLGKGSFSLLGYDAKEEKRKYKPPIHMRWPHLQADQVRGLRLREIGGGFSRHRRAPATLAACYTIAKPTMLVQKMQNIKKLRGHRDAVYCAMFDRSGRYVITGSDDRLVKIWSMETAYCLASCRGHEGDITDVAVSSNNALVASASNDCVIRTWRLPDGQPISVLRGHTGSVNAIFFSPRPSAVYQLLSSGDDGSCRLWDARYSQFKPRIYLPRPPDPNAGKSTASSSTTGQQNSQIFCCAFNASGTVFVTGSSDNLARVWNACKSSADDSEQPIHEMDILSGHENDVNYVQFSGCATTSRFTAADSTKEENFPKFKNSWFAHDNIVTCSRDGSAIIWIPRSRKSHGRAGRWTKAYHLKVPLPPTPPQPLRGGPRQRTLPKPRGVNMIVWSLDNRFVLATITGKLIIDCRICVWNAADGSLVHSLTGHTDSTYVLDVHPFNPRMAMSAGYDGKTIIWDIWEGKPIRTYETGRFKLVDGKFSPDGTSIILSDDVGQLYILSTGVGESLKDAKYDQFFLGDYRPLIRDTHGNVVDQESQLAPYRRNMQDLLCDSSMIPYPEPYQSMYQQRRLGILGIEWHPSTARFTVGPDFTSDQDQILPLPDLDVFIDPLPYFVDAMDWEPEAEVISDDMDSEFNVTESVGGDGGHISSTSSGESECSDDYSDDEMSVRDGPRRSRRRRKKREKEVTTSSGRRVKKRNLDECDGSSHRVHQKLKSKNGRKNSKKSSKGSRPRRAAARNALTLFSKIKGNSSEQEEYETECLSSDSESALEYSEFESEESDKILPDEKLKILKGKEIFFEDSEDVPRPQESHESLENGLNRRRLVLKLPYRDSKSENQTHLPGSSSSKSPNVKLKIDREGDTGRVTWVTGYINDSVKWGGVKTRTPKRIKLSIAPSLNVSGSCKETEKSPGENIKPAIKQDVKIDGQNGELKEISQVSQVDASNGFELPVLKRSVDSNGLQVEVHVASNNGAPCSMDHELNICSSEWTPNSVPARLRFAPENTGVGLANCLETSPADVANHEQNGECSGASGSTSYVGQKSCENNLMEVGVDGDFKGEQKPDVANTSLHRRKDRMFSAVYRRSRSFKAVVRTSSERDGPHAGESTSSVSCQHVNGNVKVECSVVDDIQEPHSLGIDTPEERVDRKRSVGRPRRFDDASLISGDQVLRQEWGSGKTAGLRSTRNRRINFIRDASPVDRKKACQGQRKLSWLMLSVPDTSRYIPQQGDEVAYLRQGHQEYISYSESFVRSPWEVLKREIRAVEFCKVVELDYCHVAGSGDSCCKLTLKFIDDSSSVLGKTFKLSLPEVSGFPDFLVERTRYEAAIQRNWTTRDKCQVWWKNENEDDGSWWEGRIFAVKAKSPEFPDSPWERYLIKYKSEPTETHSHSPWELHDADGTQWEQPHLSNPTTNKLLTSLSKLLESGNKAKDIYGVQKLRLVSEKSNFLNRSDDHSLKMCRFPVPMSLDVIQLRLENNYYRSFEALQHDVNVVLSNAESYFSKNAEISKKITRLSDWFSRNLLGLEH